MYDFSAYVTYCDRELAKAEVINANKQKLYDDFLTISKDYDAIVNELNNTSKLCKICQEYAVKYRDERIEELERRCESILDLAFPDEHFGVLIKTDIVRKKEVAKLLIGPKNVDKSEWFPPVSENGGLVKQLIGASIVASICEMINADFIFFDEMFCSGDPVAVADINPWFKNTVENGIQLVIIEHKPTLYENLSRREIRLAKDRVIENAVRILSIKDVIPYE